MNRPALCTGAAVVLGCACVACGSRHPSGAVPSTEQVVVHVVTPSTGTPATGATPAGRTPATAPGGVQVSATSRSHGAVATADPSGAATFHLPSGTYTISTGCGGHTTIRVTGKRPLPVRIMCPPP